MSMSKFVIISADCHATAEPADYIDYLEARYQEAYRASLPGLKQLLDSAEFMYTPEAISAYKSEAAQVDEDALIKGQWDSRRRAKALEADGVVAEVIFPNGSPFMLTSFGNATEPTKEQQGAGKRAYNRWLADFSKELPGRRAGLAQLDLNDLDGIVAEVEWAAKAGLKGLLVSSFGYGPDPMEVYDPRLEPLWSAAEANDLPVHFHGGAGPEYTTKDPNLAFLFYATETPYYTRRPLHFLIWSGVLERHPRLKVVFSETTSDWIPEALDWFDAVYHASFNASKIAIPRAPSEYWYRQCYMGASMLTDKECDRRDSTGVGNLMFGNDFPHVEGTWPKTREWLQASVGGIPESDMRRILGENAAHVYGFDLEALQDVADRVGPSPMDLAVRKGKLRPGLGAGR